MTTPTPSPTDAQIAAIVRFAAANGRAWRAALADAWLDGYARCAISQEGDKALLQQVRNGFGPSWLARFKLPKAEQPNRRRAAP